MVTRSVQSETYWFYFLKDFLADQDEIWFCDEAIQVERPDSILHPASILECDT